MFAPPQLIETEVFAAVPQNLRKIHVPAERIAAGAGGVPAGSFLEGPSFDRAAGSASAVTAAALSRSMIAFGVFAGAPMVNQEDAS